MAQMFGDRFQPGKGTGCDGELHAPPARSTSASNSSRTCPPHRVVSFESHGAGAAGAHARGRRARRLSVRNLSTIDQKTPRKRRHLAVRAAPRSRPAARPLRFIAVLSASVDLREQQQQPSEVPERPAGGGVVGSGPPGGRVPAEAACGGDLVARGGSARGESKMSCLASTLPILACSSM